jgi:hypothetical protein
MYHLLQRFSHHAERRAVDCMGPISEATAKWRPIPYTEGRVVVALGPVVGRAALWAYQHGWPLVRRLRGRATPKERSSPGRCDQEFPPSLQPHETCNC